MVGGIIASLLFDLDEALAVSHCFSQDTVSTVTGGMREKERERQTGKRRRKERTEGDLSETEG